MKEVFVRLDRCLGCKSCENACAVEHSAGKSLMAAVSEKPASLRRLYVEKVEGQKMPMICRHCKDAACVAVCRTGAMWQDPTSGVVDRNADKCVGCWMCAMVCPYGVIGRQKDARLAVKCDRCNGREVPACVEACPTHALIFSEEEEFSELLRKDAAARITRSYRARA